MHLSKVEVLWLIGIIAATFFVLAVFFISVLLINSRNRREKKIEILNAMLSIQENERKRIAEDLHDDIGPMLAAIKLQINSFGGSGAQDLPSNIKLTSYHLDSVIQNIRNIIRNLSPTNMNRRGLIASIEDFETLVVRNSNINFHFHHDGMTTSLNKNAEINIYRIIHEMLNNSLKHSNCTVIDLSLLMNKENMQIEYKDNGKLGTSQVKGNGMGLNNISHRVRLLNGKFIQCDSFKDGAYYHITLQNKNIIV
jgi:signal transduction histidine kinase